MPTKRQDAEMIWKGGAVPLEVSLEPLPQHLWHRALRSARVTELLGSFAHGCVAIMKGCKVCKVHGMSQSVCGVGVIRALFLQASDEREPSRFRRISSAPQPSCLQELPHPTTSHSVALAAGLRSVAFETHDTLGQHCRDFGAAEPGWRRLW